MMQKNYFNNSHDLEKFLQSNLKTWSEKGLHNITVGNCIISKKKTPLSYEFAKYCAISNNTFIGQKSDLTFKIEILFGKLLYFFTGKIFLKIS